MNEKFLIFKNLELNLRGIIAVEGFYNIIFVPKYCGIVIGQLLAAWLLTAINSTAISIEQYQNVNISLFVRSRRLWALVIECTDFIKLTKNCFGAYIYIYSLYIRTRAFYDNCIRKHLCCCPSSNGLCYLYCLP